jgi:hypothetical protein
MEKSQPRKFIATPEMIQLASELAVARKNAKQWGQIESNLRTDLLDLMEEADADMALTASGLPVVKITESTRKSLDKDALKIAHPEIDLEDYEKVSLVRTIKVDNV